MSIGCRQLASNSTAHPTVTRVNLFSARMNQMIGFHRPEEIPSSSIRLFINIKFRYASQFISISRAHAQFCYFSAPNYTINNNNNNRFGTASGILSRIVTSVALPQIAWHWLHCFGIVYWPELIRLIDERDMEKETAVNMYLTFAISADCNCNDCNEQNYHIDDLSHIYPV